MHHCPSCDYPLPSDRDRLGARCPNCRDPLYEPPGRVGRPAREDEGACARHAGREAVGTCGRCGNYYCEVCRTRWRDQILCASCIERVLQSREATPEQARTHFRQAILGLMMGGGAWVVLLLAVLMAVTAVVSKNVLLILLAFFLILGAALLGVLGLGQATAALRTRGPHMIAATSGLMVSGLFLGAFIGFYIFRLWFE